MKKRLLTIITGVATFASVCSADSRFQKLSDIDDSGLGSGILYYDTKTNHLVAVVRNAIMQDLGDFDAYLKQSTQALLKQH